MKKTVIVFLFILYVVNNYAQESCIVSGSVIDVQTAKVLHQAYVCIKKTKSCTTTDSTGFFELVSTNKRFGLLYRILVMKQLKYIVYTDLLKKMNISIKPIDIVAYEVTILANGREEIL